VTIPSIRVRAGDVVELGTKARTMFREQIRVQADETLVVELYSR
jgi:hypothetical protein